jgi:hypothetical protein
MCKFFSEEPLSLLFCWEFFTNLALKREHCNKAKLFSKNSFIMYTGLSLHKIIANPYQTSGVSIDIVISIVVFPLQRNTKSTKWSAAIGWREKNYAIPKKAVRLTTGIQAVEIGFARKFNVQKNRNGKPLTCQAPSIGNNKYCQMVCSS